MCTHVFFLMQMFMFSYIIVAAEAKLGKPGQPYHFAVGGMYCLNRVLLEVAKEWIG